MATPKTTIVRVDVKVAQLIKQTAEKRGLTQVAAARWLLRRQLTN